MVRWTTDRHRPRLDFEFSYVWIIGFTLAPSSRLFITSSRSFGCPSSAGAHGWGKFRPRALESGLWTVLDHIKFGTDQMEHNMKQQFAKEVVNEKGVEVSGDDTFFML